MFDIIWKALLIWVLAGNLLTRIMKVGLTSKCVSKNSWGITILHVLFSIIIWPYDLHAYITITDAMTEPSDDEKEV